MDLITNILKKIYNFLIDLSDKIYEYRNKSGNRGIC
jgi:hypothetical protein